MKNLFKCRLKKLYCLLIQYFNNQKEVTMKKLICLVICIATFCSVYANTLNGGGELKAITQVVEGKTINLQLINLQQQKTFIALSSADEDITFYTKTIKQHNGFSENLNLTALPEGRYVITVQTKAKTIRQVIRVNEVGVLFSNFS